MAEYERRDTRLMNMKFEDVRMAVMRKTGKALRASLFLIGVAILASALIFVVASISLWTLALTIPLAIIGLVAFLVPLNLFVPIYLFEEIPFFAALRKSFKYGFSAWGETFVIILVFGLLANIISGVTMAPWYVVIMFGEIFSLTEPGTGINASIWYQFISYLLGILQSYGTYISYILGAVGIAFQYFHIREKQEGISFEVSIQNFERLQ
jgi:hypothetical protein